MSHFYKGWRLYQQPDRWRAERHGVTMSARNPQELKTMIDLREDVNEVVIRSLMK